MTTNIDKATFTFHAAGRTSLKIQIGDQTFDGIDALKKGTTVKLLDGRVLCGFEARDGTIVTFKRRGDTIDVVIHAKDAKADLSAFDFKVKEGRLSKIREVDSDTGVRTNLRHGYRLNNSKVVFTVQDGDFDLRTAVKQSSEDKKYGYGLELSRRTQEVTNLGKELGKKLATKQLKLSDFNLSREDLEALPKERREGLAAADSSAASELLKALAKELKREELSSLNQKNAGLASTPVDLALQQKALDDLETAIASVKAPDDKKEAYQEAHALVANARYLLSHDQVESCKKLLTSQENCHHDQAIATILSLKATGIDQSHVKLVQSANKRTGLTNGGKDCFINSALQMVVGLGLKTDQQDDKEPGKLRYPKLNAFKQGEIKDDGGCKEVRSEIQGEILEKGSKLSKFIVDGSATSQQDAVDLMCPLLEKLEAPKLVFQQGAKEINLGVVWSLGIPKNSSPVDKKLTMSKILSHNLLPEDQRNGANGTKLTSKVVSPPESFVAQLDRNPYSEVKSDGKKGDGKRRDTVEGILSEVTLPLGEGKSQAYSPKGIICHLGDSAKSGHYIYYEKGADGKWMKYNDASITEAKMDEGSEDHRIVSTCGYLISYQKRANA